VATEKAGITAKPVTGSFKTPASKVYDGTADAAASDRAVDGKISGDDVSLVGGIASFADKKVGTAKAVTLAGAALGGADAGNYSLSSPTYTDKANITPKPLAGTFTADNKVYDATRAATVGAKSLPDVISGDDVTLSVANVLFDTKNVGIGKDVTGSLSLTGGDAGNYTVNPSHTTKASITPKGLTGSFTAKDKVYDALRAATVDGKSLPG